MIAVARQVAEEPGPDVDGRCPEPVQYGLCFGNRQASDPCHQRARLEARERIGRGRAAEGDALAVDDPLRVLHAHALRDDRAILGHGRQQLRADGLVDRGLVHRQHLRIDRRGQPEGADIAAHHRLGGRIERQ